MMRPRGGSRRESLEDPLAALQQQQEDTMSCSGEDCHGPNSDPTLADAMHMNCKGCHEGVGGPVECGACHVM